MRTTMLWWKRFKSKFSIVFVLLFVLLDELMFFLNPQHVLKYSENACSRVIGRVFLLLKRIFLILKILKKKIPSYDKQNKYE